MIFGPIKSDYRVALDELLAPFERLEREVRDCIVPLERMRRLRFNSQTREKKVATHIREAAAGLAPLFARCTLTGLAEQFRRLEAAAASAAKES
jgi:hypothetical protein